MTGNKEGFQPVGDNGVGGIWGTGDNVTAAILTEIEKRIGDEMKKVIAGIKGEGVVSGLTVSEKGTGADQSVDVAVGSCTIAGTGYTEAGIVNIALDAAHGTYARWDLIVYDASIGNPIKVTGIAGAIPTIPDLSDIDQILLAIIKREANDDVVSNAEITDKRIIIPSRIPARTEPTRAKDTEYQNTTGRAILVIISVECKAKCIVSELVNFYAAAQLKSENTSPPTVIISQIRQEFESSVTGADTLGTTTSLNINNLIGIIPNGNYYKVVTGVDEVGVVTIKDWHEYSLPFGI